MRPIFLSLALLTGGIIFGQNDCTSATVVCDTVTANPSGIGTQELNAGNQGCLTVEHNSIWYSITILSGGTFQMAIDPMGFTDFDFAMWGPNPSCAVAIQPIRCSYAIGGGNNTGINSALNTPDTDTSEGSSGNHWVQDLNVNAGETYYIMIDRSLGSGGFTLTFGGTATLDCTPTALTENSSPVRAGIFPNPSSDASTLTLEGELPGGTLHLVVTDIPGNEINSRDFEGSTCAIETSGMAAGIYIVIIRDDKSNEIAREKLMIE